MLLGLTAFTPLALGAEGDVGKLLDPRLSSENADQAQQEQAAIAKGKRLATLTEGNAVIKELDTLQSVIARWENQMKAILTSAEGQALSRKSGRRDAQSNSKYACAPSGRKR